MKAIFIISMLLSSASALAEQFPCDQAITKAVTAHFQWRSTDKFVAATLANATEEKTMKLRCLGNPKDSEGVRVSITIADCKYAYLVDQYGTVEKAGLGKCN